MNKKIDWLNVFITVISYILVAAIAASLTYLLCSKGASATSKLDQLEALIDNCFIADYDKTAIEDAAANAMVNALGDRWSYYIPASEVEAHTESVENSYVGIGVTVEKGEEDDYVLISQVEPNGGAAQAGILAGDQIIAVAGQDAKGMEISSLRQLIRGDADTQVEMTVLREEKELTVTVTRMQIVTEVVKSKMLEGNVGYIKIKNFNDRCAAETIAAIETLVEQGATSLLFDVRFNPGGYKSELVQLLDYLLPEGELFRSQDFRGNESTDHSDSSCLEMPMAVLVNGTSYSAAEFFAAALSEYGWATVVGEQTCGKGYFQNVLDLSDGSAVGLSMGKYFTPHGVSLAEAGGLTPDIPVEVDEDMLYAIYAETLEPADDPQIQAALNALKNG